MEDTIEIFKLSAIVILLIITLVSSLFPVFISTAAEAEKLSSSSKHTATKYKELISLKLPFLTAGVFLGAGLLHLLPDSIETYSIIVNDSENGNNYPTMYLLATVSSPKNNAHRPIFLFHSFSHHSMLSLFCSLFEYYFSLFA